MLVSEAIEKGGRAKMVTKSDEAFALLIFENYVDMWATSTPDGSEHDDRIPRRRTQGNSLQKEETTKTDGKVHPQEEWALQAWWVVL